MPKMTQKDRILKYLHDFGSISPVEAFEELGVMRLAARIAEIRESGNLVFTVNESKKNRYGEYCTYARYFLK